MQQSACLFFLLKETKAAPEKQDRNDLPGKDEHHDYYFKEKGRRSKDQRIKERDGRAGSVRTNRQGVLTHTKIIVESKDLGQDLKSYFKNPEYEVGSVDSGARICIIVGSEDEI